MKEYKKAIVCFKKQLQLAWFTSNLEQEMIAFDSLSLQYFYIGDVDKAKYYDDRARRGKFETNFSIVKKMSQTHAKKRASVDALNRGTQYGLITNIAETLSRLIQKEYHECKKQGQRMSADFLQES
jgi:hypothetical protein